MFLLFILSFLNFGFFYSVDGRGFCETNLLIFHSLASRPWTCTQVLTGRHNVDQHTHRNKTTATRLLSNSWKNLSSTLKTLTSLSKDVRPFLLSDNSIWSYPSVSSLSDYSISRSWRLFCLAIIAFGAFQFMVPKCYYRLGKMELKESSLLI